MGYYNIWQSTNGTVEQNPLALSDWSADRQKWLRVTSVKHFQECHASAPHDRSTTQDDDVHGVELGHTASYTNETGYKPMITLLVRHHH